MAALELKEFYGMRPKQGRFLLDQRFGYIAENCIIESGELRSLRRPIERVRTTSATPVVHRAFLLENNFWIFFQLENTFLYKTPLINDQYVRHYWTGVASTPDGYTLRFSPLINFTDKQVDPTGYIAGVPPPAAAPTVVVTGGTEIASTRAYVYTYVNVFGQESAPSPALVASGLDDALWTLTLSKDITAPFQTAPYVQTDYKVRIYRTVTGRAGQADYHFVAEVSVPAGVGTFTFPDDGTVYKTRDVALKNILPSLGWNLPPKNMDNLWLHPNGFFVGSKDNTLYFSEAFQPHAWPSAYQLALDNKIVAISGYGTTVVVLTDGNSYTVTGTTPAAMTLRRHNEARPCTSRYSVAPLLVGVIYASDTGLFAINEAGAEDITRDVITKSEWDFYDFHNIRAAYNDRHYVAFDQPGTGFMFLPEKSCFVNLTRFDPLDTGLLPSFFSDLRTGSAYVLYNNVVYDWNPPSGAPIQYRWRSKIISSPKPVNLGAALIKYSSATVTDDDGGVAPPDPPPGDDKLQDFNDAIFALKPLAPVGYDRVGRLGTHAKWKATSQTLIIPLRGSAIGRSVLFETTNTVASPTVAVFATQTFTVGSPVVDVLGFTLYADGVLKFTGAITSATMFRLPSGYKADQWEFELSGNVNIRSLQAAETGKGLAHV